MSKIVPEYIYTSPTLEEKDSLLQGDLIEIKGDFLQKFKEFYPGINHEKDNNSYALVLTQSCDLARRVVRKQLQDPASHHILVCIVRPVTSVFKSELKFRKFVNAENGYTYLEQSAYEALQLSLSRLINNSESTNLFFLPKTATLKEELVAVLSVSFPFRCSSVYQSMIEARVATLKPEFRAKIGYMLADLYGRVATSDLFEVGWNDPDLIKYAGKILGDCKIVNGYSRPFIAESQKKLYENTSAIEADLISFQSKIKETSDKAFLKQAARVAFKDVRNMLCDWIRDPEFMDKLQKLEDGKLKQELDRHLRELSDKMFPN